MIIRTILVAENENESVSRLEIDGEDFGCILEDQYRESKVMGDTRIPAARYALGLRKVGGHHLRYLKKFPAFHVGMIEILNILNFIAVLFHIGNNEADTAGCLLLGAGFTENNGKLSIYGSEVAYVRFYKKVAPALARGEEVILEHRI